MVYHRGRELYNLTIFLEEEHMKKVTYDMLIGFGEVVSSIYRMLYPDGLTLEQLEEKAERFHWLEAIYKRFKEE